MMVVRVGVLIEVMVVGHAWWIQRHHLAEMMSVCW